MNNLLDTQTSNQIKTNGNYLSQKQDKRFGMTVLLFETLLSLIQLIYFKYRKMYFK